jgi:hypothetical protein
MLRIRFLQQWFDPSNPATEDAICDSGVMRRLVRVEFVEGTNPMSRRSFASAACWRGTT